jgi:hypothetical protein
MWQTTTSKAGDRAKSLHVIWLTGLPTQAPANVLCANVKKAKKQVLAHCLLWIFGQEWFADEQGRSFLVVFITSIHTSFTCLLQTSSEEISVDILSRPCKASHTTCCGRILFFAVPR